MRIVTRESTADGKLIKCFIYLFFLILFLSFSAFWNFRRHFPEIADSLYGSLDPATQRTLEKERDSIGTNGTNSMSVSLRGSNTSLNSVPSGVISMCAVYVYLYRLNVYVVYMFESNSTHFLNLEFCLSSIHPNRPVIQLKLSMFFVFLSFPS